MSYEYQNKRYKILLLLCVYVSIERLDLVGIAVDDIWLKKKGMFEYGKKFIIWLLSLIQSFYHWINPFPVEKIARQQQVKKGYAKLSREKGSEKRHRDYAGNSKLWKQHMSRPAPRKRRA
ncbi:Dendrin [Dirofilaria immitis]